MKRDIAELVTEAALVATGKITLPFRQLEPAARAFEKKAVTLHRQLVSSVRFMQDAQKKQQGSDGYSYTPSDDFVLDHYSSFWQRVPLWLSRIEKKLDKSSMKYKRYDPAFFGSRMVKNLKGINHRKVCIVVADVDMTDECIMYNSSMQEYRVQPSSVIRVTKLIKG